MVLSTCALSVLPLSSTTSYAATYDIAEITGGAGHGQELTGIDLNDHGEVIGRRRSDPDDRSSVLEYFYWNENSGAESIVDSVIRHEDSLSTNARVVGINNQGTAFGTISRYITLTTDKCDTQSPDFCLTEQEEGAVSDGFQWTPGSPTSPTPTATEFAYQNAGSQRGAFSLEDASRVLGNSLFIAAEEFHDIMFFGTREYVDSDLEFSNGVAPVPPASTTSHLIGYASSGLLLWDEYEDLDEGISGASPLLQNISTGEIVDVGQMIAASVEGIAADDLNATWLSEDGRVIANDSDGDAGFATRFFTWDAENGAAEIPHNVRRISPGGWAWHNDLTTIWKDGDSFDLQSMIDPSTGYAVDRIEEVNENGQILARVNTEGMGTRLVLLTSSSDFRWTTPGFGDWNDGENWDGGVAPGLADNAVIGASGNYAIALESDIDLTDLLISPTDDDDLQVTLGPAPDVGPIAMHLGTLRVGGDDRTLAASEASLTLSDLNVTVFEDVTLGGTTVGTAKLTIAPGTAAVLENELHVGDLLAAGVLEVVATGGTAATLESGALTVGGNDLAPGETSEVLVRGADANYSISGQVTIGEAAHSYFEVAEGGTVSVGDALSVTLDQGSRLYVHGEDSSFSYRDGDGELRIEDGVAEFDDMATGAFFAARVGGGDSSPDGEPGLGVRNGAALELSGDLKVGLLGSGFVAIEQQGRITAGDVNIGPPEAVDNEQTATVIVREDGVLESLDVIIIGSAREEAGELLTSSGHLGVESGGQVNVLGTGGAQVDYGSLDVDGVTSEVRSLAGPLEIGNARAAFTGGAFGSFESVTVQAPLGGEDPAQLVIAHSTVEAGNPLGTDVTVGGEAGGVIAMINGLLDAEGGEVFIDHNGVIAGTGTVRGDVSGSGSISTGLSPGTLTIDGNFQQAPDGRLKVEIAGANPGTEHDQLIVTGDATIDGTILFEFLDGFAPEAGQTFEFLSIGGLADLSGATFAVQNLAPGFEFDIDVTGTGFQMAALNDGHFVPEPSSLALLALAIAPALGWRGRRH